MPAHVRTAHLTAVIVILALAGMGISGYLTTVHYADRPVFCGGLSSCETVNTSEYAELMGVPVALFGLGAYALIGALALLRSRLGSADLALFGVAAGGLLYSAYLTWVELAILHAVCLWCAASAVVITLITILAAALVLRADQGGGALSEDAV